MSDYFFLCITLIAFISESSHDFITSICCSKFYMSGNELCAIRAEISPRDYIQFHLLMWTCLWIFQVYPSTILVMASLVRYISHAMLVLRVVNILKFCPGV